VPTLGGSTAGDSGGGPAQHLQWAKTRAAASRTPAYVYYYTHVMPGPDAAQYGAFHTSDMPYALNTLFMSDRPFTAADHKVADLMSSYWANFARTGNPNGPGLPLWKSTTENPDQVMEIAERAGMINPPTRPAPSPAAPVTPPPAPAAR
jgi:para-nitrobenzyl esterase